MEEGKHIGHEIRIVSNLIKRHMDTKIVKHTYNADTDGSPTDGDSQNAESQDAGIDELTGMQSFIIRYIFLNESNEIFQRDIEKKFGIRRSTATKILQLMEKKGLIVRETVDYDARLKKLRLTPKAVEVHFKITEDIRAFEAKMRKGLSEEELDMFFDIIEKIKENIQN